MTNQPVVDSDKDQPVVCAKCGQTHTRCSGHSNRTGGGPCGRHPMDGQRVCWTHGGNARQARKAAARRVQEAELAKTARAYGVARDVNPLQAMVELLQDTAGAVVWLRDRIRETEPDALVWGIADEVDKGSGEFPGVDRKFAAAPSVWLQRYDMERRLLLDVSEKLARLGMDWDAREAVRRQGAALARVGREFARLLGHDPDAVGTTEAWRGALRAVVGVDGSASAPGVVEGRVVKADI